MTLQMTSQQTARKSLQQKMDEHGSALDMLRNAQAGPYVFPIPAEYSNWREEQRAWRETVALMDMSFHMSDLYIEGPDAKKFIASLAVKVKQENTIGCHCIAAFNEFIGTPV